jgi:hypothetical protein
LEGADAEAGECDDGPEGCACGEGEEELGEVPAFHGNVEGERGGGGEREGVGNDE